MRLCDGQRERAATALAAALFCALFSVAARASEIFDFYSGTRQLGMGNSYVGVVNDETALLTNPAGLGRLRDFTFNIFNPQLEGSVADTSIFTASNYSSATDAQGILNALNQNQGVPYDLRAQIFPSIVMPDFGVGALAKDWYDALVNTSTNTYTLHYVSDFAAAMGYALRFFGGVFKLGVDGRIVDRTEANISTPATSTGLSIDSVKREGMGIASDIGIVLTAPVAWFPAIAAVARDVGGTSYNLGPGMFGNTTYRPADTPTRIDAAFTVSPILGKSTRSSITLEAHDLVALASSAQGMIYYHAGFEVNFSDFFFLRGGMNQGYWTAGVEFATRFFQLQASSYGQEVGTTSATIEDRRWVGSFAIRF